jgi:hypothetical protein
MEIEARALDRYGGAPGHEPYQNGNEFEVYSQCPGWSSVVP